MSMTEPERLALAGSPQWPAVPLSLWRQPEPAAPLVLLVPALGAAARAYARLAGALHGQGVQAATLELRGVGESPLRASRGTDWGYADLVDGELRGAVVALRQALPAAPLVVLGHSLGGHLALLLQARHPDAGRLDGLALVASGAPYWRAYPGISKPVVGALGLLARGSSHALGYFPGRQIGFGGRQAARLMHEWGRFVRTGQPQVDGWSDPAWRARLRTVQLPLLALAMRGDRYAPPASMRHLIGLSAMRTELRLLGPPQAPAGHFGFMKQPDEVARQVAGFALGLAARRAQAA